MKRRSPIWLRAALCLPIVLALALAACEGPKPKVKTPALLLYLEGQALSDQQLYGEALVKFQDAADQNVGTLLGSFSNLRIAEIRAEQGEWVKAETNYRLFLGSNEHSHLTPYVLYKLAKVNHQASYTGLFFPSREVDRDQQPNRQIIQEYQRFFFLYPRSIYLPEVRDFAVEARITLAEHERTVADFYYDRGHYHAAAARYLYLLRTYPEYPQVPPVLERLIDAYRLNRQPELADELERLARPQTSGPAGPERPAREAGAAPPASPAPRAGQP